MYTRTGFSSQRVDQIFGSPRASKLFGKDLTLTRDAIVKEVEKERKSPYATTNGTNPPQMEATTSANQGESLVGVTMEESLCGIDESFVQTMILVCGILCTGLGQPPYYSEWQYIHYGSIVHSFEV
ncbi:hypothetical protein ACH5RR_031494 [Cinchona calisaya]|uniref:Uncharacterized protein n=1 Tax=Cinchona calisaya TaxID=153742 RepID=A0ABD2YFF1_9GENT